MLVISRKLDEKVVINGNIVVTVLGMDRGKAILGIEAPREIPVWRSELLTEGLPSNVKPRPAPERSFERWADQGSKEAS